MSDRYHALLETPLGWVAVLATSRGVRRTVLPRPTPEAALAALREAEGEIGPEDPARLRPVLDRLQAFYRGIPVTFDDVPVDLEGRPPFSRAVWKVVRQVPWGATVTYGEVARRLGKPRAARAVGRAMATNPVPPIVPCHRVIGHNGHLTGFGGRLGLKAHLLAQEAASVPPRGTDG